MRFDRFERGSRFAPERVEVRVVAHRVRFSSRPPLPPRRPRWPKTPRASSSPPGWETCGLPHPGPPPAAGNEAELAQASALPADTTPSRCMGGRSETLPAPSGGRHRTPEKNATARRLRLSVQRHSADEEGVPEHGSCYAPRRRYCCVRRAAHPLHTVRHGARGGRKTPS